MEDPKARLKKLLHVGKRELGLDEDAYRLLLQSATGKTSSSAMTVPELEKALERMKHAGFRVRARKGSRKAADDPQSKKLRGLWLELHEKGVVRNPEEAALAAWVKRMTGVEALEWLSSAQASRCIEEAKKWLKRVARERSAG